MDKYNTLNDSLSAYLLCQNQINVLKFQIIKSPRLLSNSLLAAFVKIGKEKEHKNEVKSNFSV